MVDFPWRFVSFREGNSSLQRTGDYFKGHPLAESPGWFHIMGTEGSRPPQCPRGKPPKKSPALVRDYENPLVFVNKDIRPAIRAKYFLGVFRGPWAPRTGAQVLKPKPSFVGRFLEVESSGRTSRTVPLCLGIYMHIFSVFLRWWFQIL